MELRSSKLKTRSTIPCYESHWFTDLATSTPVSNGTARKSERWLTIASTHTALTDVTTIQKHQKHFTCNFMDLFHPQQMNVNTSSCDDMSSSCFREPVGCSTGNCQYLLTWTYDGSSPSVSFEMEAPVATQNYWVAFGLSADQNMVYNCSLWFNW